MGMASSAAARAMRGLTLGTGRVAARSARPAMVARGLAAQRRHGLGLARTALEIGSKACISSGVASLGVEEGVVSDSASKQVTTSKYKLKTRKAAAIRFKVTGNGKVVRGKQDLNTKKNAKRKRFLGAPAVVEKGDIPNIKGSMPNHKIKCAPRRDDGAKARVREPWA